MLSRLASTKTISRHLGVRYFTAHDKQWQKIAPHVHGNEIEGEDTEYTRCREVSATEDPDRYEMDFDRGIYSNAGVCRYNLDAYNKALEEDKFDIMCVSTNTSPYGVNPLKYSPTDYSMCTSFKGVPGVEVQNDRAKNPFGVLGPPDLKEFDNSGDTRGLQLHTLTIGNPNNKAIGKQSLDSVSFIVHPHYYDTVDLIREYFEDNKRFNKETQEEDGQKAWILKNSNDLQFGWNEIDVKLIAGIYSNLNNGARKDRVWKIIKEALENQSDYLKSLNVRGLEVYNGFRAGEWSGGYLDELLMQNHDYLAFAGNDAYFYQGEETDTFEHLDDSRLVPLGCIYGVVDTKTLESYPSDALLDCINKREFYASSGLVIHDPNERKYTSIVERKSNTKFKLTSHTKKVHWRAIQYNEGSNQKLQYTNWTKPRFNWTYDTKNLAPNGDGSKFKFVRFEARECDFTKYHHQLWLQPFWNYNMNNQLKRY